MLYFHPYPVDFVSDLIKGVFQIVVLAMPIACTTALIDFPTFLPENGLLFSHRHLSVLHVGLPILTTKKQENNGEL